MKKKIEKFGIHVHVGKWSQLRNFLKHELIKYNETEFDQAKEKSKEVYGSHIN